MLFTEDTTLFVQSDQLLLAFSTVNCEVIDTQTDWTKLKASKVYKQKREAVFLFQAIAVLEFQIPNVFSGNMKKMHLQDNGIKDNNSIKIRTAFELGD